MPSRLKPKAGPLLEQLNALFETWNWTEFSLQKLRRDAELLVEGNKTIPDSYVALGAVATLQNDPEGARSAFRRAMGRFPGDSLVLRNYSVSLLRLGYSEESITLANDAVQRNQGSFADLEQLIASYIQSGKFLEAEGRIKEMKKMFPERDLERFNPVLNIQGVLNNNQIEQHVIESYHKLAYSVLHDAGIYLSRYHARVAVDDESEWISNEIEILQSVSDAVDLNFKLADKVAASDFLPMIHNKVSVQFTVLH